MSKHPLTSGQQEKWNNCYPPAWAPKQNPSKVVAFEGSRNFDQKKSTNSSHSSNLCRNPPPAAWILSSLLSIQANSHEALAEKKNWTKTQPWRCAAIGLPRHWRLWWRSKHQELHAASRQRDKCCWNRHRCCWTRTCKNPLYTCFVEVFFHSISSWYYHCERKARKRNFTVCWACFSQYLLPWYQRKATKRNWIKTPKRPCALLAHLGTMLYTTPPCFCKASPSCPHVPGTTSSDTWELLWVGTSKAGYFYPPFSVLINWKTWKKPEIVFCKFSGPGDLFKKPLPIPLDGCFPPYLSYHFPTNFSHQRQVVWFAAAEAPALRNIPASMARHAWTRRQVDQ